MGANKQVWPFSRHYLRAYTGNGYIPLLGVKGRGQYLKLIHKLLPKTRNLVQCLGDGFGRGIVN